MKFANFVVPLFEGIPSTMAEDPDKPYSFVGTAFFIDNYLVTARHVISSPKVYYMLYNGEYIDLHPSGWLRNFPNKQTGKTADVAIYDANISSLLKLASCYNVNNNDEVKLLYYQGKGNEAFLYEAVVVQKLNFPCMGDKFAVYSNRLITHGSSGAPVLYKDKVIGLIAAGFDNCEVLRPVFLQQGHTDNNINEFFKEMKKYIQFEPLSFLSDIIEEYESDSFNCRAKYESF